jgi:2-iminobutanoate/2-iminopropanoate deaminase
MTQKAKTSDKIRCIATDKAPKANGPYSQAVVAGGFIYTAGQLPRDPATNQLVTGGITEQAKQVFDNLGAILRAGGASFGDVVKVTVYLTDLDDFAAMNEVMITQFGEHKPARTTIQAAKLPSGASVEIDMIALAPDA